MFRRLVFSMFLAGAGAIPAQAEFTRITTAEQFLTLVGGRTLIRPMVRLKVAPAGTISGVGAQWAVSGRWTWRDGYFCRDLRWGGDDMGRSCDQVKVNGRKIRFTSERGAGRSAVFHLGD